MTHSLPYAVNCSILFTELPILERPAAARSAGFDAVEFWWPFASVVPADTEVDAFTRAVEEAGVQLVGLNFAAGDMPAGDRGLLSQPARSKEFRDNVAVTVGIGDQLGCRVFNALYGNRVAGVVAEEQDELAAENLVLAAQAAAQIGAQVVIEPISGAEHYPLLTATDAFAVIDRVHARSGLDNLALLADLYHLSVNGEDLDALIAEHVDRIGHVQIADAPGRNQPGTGILAIDSYLLSLEQHGYAGWVGLEYKPLGASSDSFGWVAPNRRSAGR
ncbi:MAG: hyi [Marmoricola sp.]|nr:hyi [Marmoricola sp.]